MASGRSVTTKPPFKLRCSGLFQCIFQLVVDIPWTQEVLCGQHASYLSCCAEFVQQQCLGALGWHFFDYRSIRFLCRCILRLKPIRLHYKMAALSNIAGRLIRYSRFSDSALHQFELGAVMLRFLTGLCGISEVLHCFHNLFLDTIHGIILFMRHALFLVCHLFFDARLSTLWNV